MARQHKAPNVLSEVSSALSEGVVAVILVMLFAAITIGKFVPRAGAVSAGSIAVYDASDESLKFYNAATAALFVPNEDQLVFSGFEEETYVDGYDAPWFAVKDLVRSIEVVDDGIQPSNTQRWFKDFSSLESADVAKLDMSKAISISQMFSGCSSLKDISMTSNWNLSNCLDVSNALSNMKSLETADISRWNLTANNVNTTDLFKGDSSLKRLIVSGQTRLASMPEHAIHGSFGQDWAMEFDGGIGGSCSPNQMLDVINSGQGEGAWVWAPLSNEQLRSCPKVEERIRDAKTGKWTTITDASAGEDLEHVIKATFPAAIGSYQSYPVEIAEDLGGLVLSSLDDVSISLDGQDLTSAIKDGPWGSITYEGNILTVAINDVKSGLSVSRSSVLSVTYKARLTSAAVSGEAGTLTTTTMRYPSPPSRPTEDFSEAIEAHTKTVAYSLRVSRVSSETREAVPGSKFTIKEKTTGLFVQADGSLGESSYDFETDSEGNLVAGILSQGEYVVHDSALPITDNVLVAITASYESEGMGIGTLSANVIGSGVAQPVDGELFVGADEDGLVSIDEESGLVGIRVSGPTSGSVDTAASDGREDHVANRVLDETVANIDMVVRDDTSDNTAWGKIADANTNEDIPYQITVGLPADYENYSAYFVQVVNVLPEGKMELQGGGTDSVHIYLGEQDVTSQVGQVAYDGSALTVTISDLRLTPAIASTKIVIAYSAHLTGDATLGDEGNVSEASLIASSIPSDPSQVSMLGQSAVRTTTYGIVVDKVNSISGEAVAGSGYVVSTASGDLTSYVQEDGTLTVAEGAAHTFVSDENGKLKVSGLDEGSYTFHEVVRTDEYSETAKDFTVTLSSIKGITAGSLAGLNATYSGGMGELNHVGDGLAEGDEDGVQSILLGSGTVTVRSSAEPSLVMPLVGLAGIRKVVYVGILIAVGTVGIAFFVNKKFGASGRWETYNGDGSKKRKLLVNHVKADYSAILDKQ